MDGHPTFFEGLILSADIIGQMGILVLMGYLMVRRNWISQDTLSDLTRLLIDGIIPCAFILSMARSLNGDLLHHGLMLAGIGFVWIMTSYIVGLIWFKFFPGTSTAKNRSVIAMMMIQNGIYLPLPVILAVTPPELHDEAVVYISIAAIPSIGLMWTLGLMLLGSRQFPDFRQRLKLMVNAPLIALLFGVLIAFVPGVPEAARQQSDAWRPLRMAFSVMNYLSTMLSPMAMLILGGFIAGSRRSERCQIRHVLPLISVRLLLVPAAVLLLIRSGWVDLPPLANTALLLIASAPSATNTSLIARKYNGEWELVASLQLIVHLVALVTVPLWLTFGLMAQ